MKTDYINPRFPVGIGILGYVAGTGETLNVENAYNDPRFNQDIDKEVRIMMNHCMYLLGGKLSDWVHHKLHLLHAHHYQRKYYWCCRVVE